jgi:hypothetical protein
MAFIAILKKFISTITFLEETNYIDLANHNNTDI